MKFDRKLLGEKTDSPVSLEGGHYWRDQLRSPDPVIAWSHEARFRIARSLIAPFAGQRLLDYGCGDATFLYLVHDYFPRALGVDRAELQLASCRTRFAATHLTFSTTAALQAPHHVHAYDVITCMEVLEHCLDEEVDNILSSFHRLLAPGGTLIISVPIENGPSLLVKEVIRTIAAWRSLGHYKSKERYRASELIKMAFADQTTSIVRPRYPETIEGNQVFYHGHKGFNWRALRERVERSFRVQKTLFSPCEWSLGYLSSQAWLVALKK